MSQDSHSSLQCIGTILYISQYLFTQLIRFYFNSLLLLMPSRIVVEKAGCLESGIVAYLLSVQCKCIGSVAEQG